VDHRYGADTLPQCRRWSAGARAHRQEGGRADVRSSRSCVPVLLLPRVSCY